MTIYTFSMFTYFPSGVNPQVLELDILEDPAITTSLTSVVIAGTDVQVAFSSSLSPAEEAELQVLVDNHDPNSRVFDTTAILQQVSSSGTNGGNFASGSWLTRPLNTLDGQNIRLWLTFDPSSKQITLAEGTYLIEALGSNVGVGVSQFRFININDSNNVIHGITSSSGISNLEGKISVPSGGAIYALQQRCTTSNILGTGFGQAGNFGSPEIYAILKITQSS